MRLGTGCRPPPLFLALVLAALAHGVLLWGLNPAFSPRPIATEPGVRELEIALTPLQPLPPVPTSAPVPVTPRVENQDPSPVTAGSGKSLPTAPSAAEAIRPPPGRLSASSLSQQIADVSADLSQALALEQKNRKIVYLKSLQAHKAVATAYEQAWQEKVERIGNLNYPEQARKDRLSGALTLAVGLRPDGSLYSIRVLRSSGHAVLDEAAKNIVNLSAPFAPFPEALKQEAGVLVITRTWRFLDSHHLETRGD